MKMYKARWASTWYSCEDCRALVRILRELGATSFLVAVLWDAPCLPDNVLETIDVIVWVEEVEL